MEPITNHLAVITTNPQEVEATKEQTQLPTQDLLIERAIVQGKKAGSAELNELDQMFRRIYMLVGLRPQFIPNELELVFLYQFVTEEYKNHTLEEIELAFRLAVKGTIVDDDGKVIELYDYFSPAYFGKVMRAYRSYSASIGNRIADKAYVEKLKQMDNGKEGEVIDWREVIEADYQFFLSNINTSSTYPEDHYKTLVEDGQIKEDFWVKKFRSTKINLLNDLNRDLVMLQNSKKLEEDKGAFSKYHEINRLINKYSTSAGDDEIELIAKQKCVLAYFKHNKDLGNKNLYVRK